MKRLLLALLLMWSAPAAAWTHGSGIVTVPFNSTIGFAGDSITANVFTTTSTFNQWNDNGFVAWGMMFGNSLVAMKSGGMQATAGTTSSDLAGQITALNAINVGVVSIETGTNDIAGNVSGATIVSNIAAAIATSNAKLFIVSTILPRYGSSAFSVPQEAQRVIANTGILALVSSKIIVSDANAAGLISSDFIFNGTDQGVHPNQSGAYKDGKVWGMVLGTRVNGTLSNFEGLFSSGTVFNPNNGLQGTAGTTSGGATGSVATNYSLGGNTNGVTVTASKSGVGDNQIITLGGSYTGAGTQLFGLGGFNFGIVGLANGDMFEMLLEAKVLTNFSTNVTTMTINPVIFDTGFGTIAQSFAFAIVAPTGFPWATSDGTITFRTPPFKIPAGNAPANVFSNIAFNAASGTSIATSGAIQIMNMAIRKVN